MKHADLLEARLLRTSEERRVQGVAHYFLPDEICEYLMALQGCQFCPGQDQNIDLADPRGLDDGVCVTVPLAAACDAISGDKHGPAELHVLHLGDEVAHLGTANRITGVLALDHHRRLGEGEGAQTYVIVEADVELGVAQVGDMPALPVREARQAASLRAQASAIVAM